MTLTIKEQIEGFLACMFPVTEANAKRVVTELESCRNDWSQLANDWNKRSVFAQIYLSLSEAYFKVGDFTKAVDTIKEGIAEYSKVAEYAYNVKGNMYHSLGVYQSYCGQEVDALASFRKSIFFLTINNTTYRNIPLYCYKKVSDYTIDDLKKSRITLTDPQEFDDPVDCLVFPWMEKSASAAKTQGDKVAARLINEAFSYIRIKCFVRNAPLPSPHDPRPTSTVKKAEYSNVIMWPTYADYHKGICMEYHLPASLQQPDMANERTFFLSDVDYKDIVELGESLSIKQGFFTKSTEWEFEKETRLLYYDTTSKEKFKSIDIPKDSLKKVFFGLRCTEESTYKVIQALQDNNGVEFFKMRIPPDDVYSFVPEKIDEKEFCADYESRMKTDAGCRCLGSLFEGIINFFKWK